MSSNVTLDRVESLRAIRNWIEDRLFLLLACSVGIYCLFFVPQVSHLIGQPPIRTFDKGLFFVLLAILLLFYVVTLIDIVRPIRVRGLAVCLMVVNDWLVLTATAMRSYSTGLWGYVLPVLMVVPGCLAAWQIPLELETPYQMFGAALKMGGAWIALVGLFLLYGKLIGPDSVIAWAAATRRPHSQAAELASQQSLGVATGEHPFSTPARRKSARAGICWELSCPGCS